MMRRGMTLVEVVVATVIFGLGVAGLMSAAAAGMRNQQKGEIRAAALGVAQQKLSEVDLIGAHVWMLSRPTTGEETLGEQTFRWTLTIQQQPVGELFAVRAQVEWPGGGNTALETWLNDYGAKTTETGDRDAKK
jgi:prepilin-type N-terminal cleavage/methylation domain-containing protein